MLPRPQLIQVLTHSAVAFCPSVYEPFGLVNVEAMACATAVVATDVGGIPEIVVDGETGMLVHIELGADGQPADPERFVADLAEAVQRPRGRPRHRRADGRARPQAGGRRVLLALHRLPHRRALRVAAVRQP